MAVSRDVEKVYDSLFSIGLAVRQEKLFED